MPLPHPSWRNTGWIKRNPWFEAELLPVLRADVTRLLRSRGSAATAAGVYSITCQRSIPRPFAETSIQAPAEKFTKEL
jgi:hypothetical protein